MILLFLMKKYHYFITPAFIAIFTNACGEAALPINGCLNNSSAVGRCSGSTIVICLWKSLNSCDHLPGCFNGGKPEVTILNKA